MHCGVPQNLRLSRNETASTLLLLLYVAPCQAGGWRLQLAHTAPVRCGHQTPERQQQQQQQQRQMHHTLKHVLIMLQITVTCYGSRTGFQPQMNSKEDTSSCARRCASSVNYGLHKYYLVLQAAKTTLHIIRIIQADKICQLLQRTCRAFA
jgi:hypothetical protein